jgi:uncharacterized protein YunC (DUF1805 family)
MAAMAGMDELEIGGVRFAGVSVPTEHSVLLLIRGARGLLGCGYLSLEAADRLGDALAIVRGVRNYAEMQAAAVTGVSRRARELGIAEGMTGAQALALLS